MKNSFLSIVLLTSVILAHGQWGIGIDAQPLLLYSGNVVGGTDDTPNWAGSEGLEKGVDLFRFRPDKEDWVRYRVAMSISADRQKSIVQALNEDLTEIVGSMIEESTTTNELALQFGIQREKWVGEQKLKGLYGYGTALNLSARSKNQEIGNPLRAYLGDTLWYDSGYSFGASIFVQTGILYEISPEIVVSSRLGFGFDLNTQSQEEIRTVELISGSAELIQEIYRPSSQAWRLDTFLIPQFTLTFYFGSQEDSN